MSERKNTHAPMPEAYHAAMDGIGFTSEAKQRMKGSLKARLAHGVAPTAEFASAATSGPDAAKILELPGAASATAAATAPTARSARPRRRIRSRWAIAAGLAAALLIGGGTAAIATGAISVPLPAAVADLFGGAPADTKIVDKVGRPVGATATSNGVTVTADAIVGDASNIKVLYTVARDDGKPFDIPASATSKDGLLMVGFDFPSSIIDGTSGMGGGSYFYDADPTDNKIQYVEEWSVDADSSLIGKTMRVDLRDLKVYSGTVEANTGNEESGDQSANPAAAGDILAKGEWKLSFKIDYEDSSRLLGAGVKLSQGGMSATVDKASISPVGFTIEYTVDGVIDDSKMGSNGMMSDEANAELEKFYDQDYVIMMKDGSTIETSNTGGSSHKEGNTERVKRGFFFDRIIDVDQVASVTVNGVELPLA